MSALLDSTLDHLEQLVSFDTRNPPRSITTDGIFSYVKAHLPGFQIEMTDHGAGAVSLYAVRGTPNVLFNVHLDTVPDSPAWSADPHVMRRAVDRVIGLGVCDIKGAAAALLAAVQATDGPAALLFTSDEEANDPRGVAAFLKRNIPYHAVLVAEPTMSQAVLAHRGISAVLMKFTGRAGHASAEQQPQASALHQAMRWGVRALDYTASLAHTRFGGLTGLRFNIGRLEGGIKANIIAPTAELRFGLRPLPSMDVDQLLAALAALAVPAPASFEETFRGPSLPWGGIATAEIRRLSARDIADALHLPIGNAVDFWTEASLFSACGYTALVYGPGDIAQAHTADEFVTLQQLQRYAESVYRIINAT
ncbi:acetylornithine deacetylase [Xylella fastidiosa subsp. morus]|jgi:acetylornithine deacetylase|uniref:N-acetyl-L-citrulline deacetylase n=5 Tax=Xylella fastidiosa TaxID=2371 RepID=Q87EL3_XYLFT|nr:acetylornithine deacetylase [Xylella fastidiosa]ADN63285.1 acetylornithine deacetylase [Xylella fastidiosa subsp. fastidiosa GB514]KAF0571860.1 acetylornithine deacetylase [Xylella fastidiosa subsp. fastidiosa Mus-1]AAO28177.1 acetylornithine deacetylase [Xylella fastidiosa Temecula1]ACA11337.1 acetylornithine deacetylase [Xylella fastidiosa M12]ACB91735.1 peptidase dimerisation domain protein [Xylella fastidiosa M23]